MGGTGIDVYTVMNVGMRCGYVAEALALGKDISDWHWPGQEAMGKGRGQVERGLAQDRGGSARA